MLTLNRLQMLKERRGQECKRPDGGNREGRSERVEDAVRGPR